MLRLTNQDLTVKKTRGVKKAARAGKSVLKDAPREDAPREKEKDLSPESLEALEEALAGKLTPTSLEELRSVLKDAPREKEKDLSPESLEALEEALAGKGQAMTMEEFRAFLAEP